jgi:7,8-dihydroneopterin aldolase/epimerase/oxygenase
MTEINAVDLYAIHVRALDLLVSIGIYDFERAAPQSLVISASLILHRKQSFSEDIKQVQDYDFIRTTAQDLAKRGHFELQETFCQDLLARCMLEQAVLGAVVRTEKSTVYPDAKGVGCTMALVKAPLQTIPSWLIAL